MTDNFLWHEISEGEREDIKKQAKEIMDSFSDKLSKIDSKKLKDSLIERGQGEREEGGERNKIDKKIMFENAPDAKDGTSKNNDFIIAEKKSW